MIIGALTKPPRFLEVDEILTLQESAVDEYGGSYGVRDQGLLEAAISMPRQAFGGTFAHDVPFGMAAAYAFHLCKNHPFVDGNKRAALAACVVFLRLNGWEIHVPDLEAADQILAVAEGRIDKAALAEWIAARARPRASMELRDFFRQVDYGKLAAMFEGIAAGPSAERVASMMEAGESIIAVHQANIGAMAAEAGGDHGSAAILRHHAMLMTALYRLAEEMGYEW